MTRPEGFASTSRSVAVSPVACGRECERVAREKSSKRSRSVTVRATRCAARRRRARRSTSASTSVSSLSSERGRRPSARWVPIDRRRLPTTTGRGSRLCASAWMCRPAARPNIPTNAVSSSLATSATVVRDRSRSFRAVTTPTPHSRSTGSACRKASSPSTGTTRSPSGFATPLATFARNLVRATPTVMGIPTRSRTSARRRAAMSVGAPAIRRRPPTSRNASSMDSPSTSGEVSRKTSNIAALASEYAFIRGRTTTACGHRRRACVSPIGV